LAFTAPSALCDIVFGYGVTDSATFPMPPAARIESSTVAVVAMLCGELARNLCPDRGACRDRLLRGDPCVALVRGRAISVAIVAAD